MRILKVDISESYAGSGLKAIRMQRLGQVVLLAGRNGAGKSRALERIEKQAIVSRTTEEVELLRSDIAYKQISIESIKKHKDQETDRLKQEKNQGRIELAKRNIDHYNNEIAKLKKEIHLAEKKLSQTEHLLTSNPGQKPIIVKFVPKNLKMNDPYSMSKQQLDMASTNIGAIGIEQLPLGALPRIQKTQDIWFNSTHPNSGLNEKEISQASNQYHKLKTLLELFLETELGRNKDGDATLFGFRIGEARFSDGQAVLLQLCMAIYAQGASLKNVILFMDEPENHLHPKAITEALDKIIENIPGGQVWIATHSLPILAHFNPSSIWYVEDGKIEFAGKIPEKVLSGLLGGEEEQAKLKDFIGLPAQMASARYAFECLSPPAVVLTGTDDDQSNQIRRVISEMAGGDQLRILDYGAGKGRIISNLADLDAQQNEEFLSRLDYIAFDEYENNKEDCERSILKAYETVDRRYFNGLEDLLGIYDRNSFDVVVLCNVLHEIDPNEWISLFRTDGKISKLLKPDGFVLLVEDHQLPAGEKAYQKGFLVLNTPAIRELFCITEADEGFTVDDARNDGRLKAHLIPSNCLQRITTESLKSSLRSIKGDAEERIRKIRGEETNYRNGRIHGFWVQQFANAQLSLSELGG